MFPHHYTYCTSRYLVPPSWCTVEGAVLVDRSGDRPDIVRLLVFITWWVTDKVQPDGAHPSPDPLRGHWVHRGTPPPIWLFFFELWRYPPSDAVLTPAISPISVEGRGVLFLPVQVQRTCPCPEEREDGWNRQHPSRTGPNWWRGCHQRSPDNPQYDLANWRMANSVDSFLSHHTSEERQPASVPELPNDQPYQSLKQSHAEDHTEQFEASSGDYHWKAGRLRGTKEHHRADTSST